jgi:hypothetical protein
MKSELMSTKTCGNLFKQSLLLQEFVLLFFLCLCLSCHPKLNPSSAHFTKVSVPPLYLDTDNEIILSGFLSYPAERLTVVIDNGTIAKTNNDLFIARVERLGEAKVTILYEGKVLRVDEYKVLPFSEKQ